MTSYSISIVLYFSSPVRVQKLFHDLGNSFRNLLGLLELCLKDVLMGDSVDLKYSPDVGVWKKAEPNTGLYMG